MIRPPEQEGGVGLTLLCTADMALPAWRDGLCRFHWYFFNFCRQGLASREAVNAAARMTEPFLPCVFCGTNDGSCWCSETEE